MTIQLQLAQLGERHPGLTNALGESYAEAAAVCLSRHHQSPVEAKAAFNQLEADCLLVWEEPDSKTTRAYANEIDATEQGAYGVSLAAVESLVGLVAIRRAETMTGADYYVAPVGSDPDDLEDCLRLEVSGVSSGGRAAVEGRLRAKLVQAAKGDSNLPALAAVVGFRERLIAIARLGGEQ
jgi:hypothetical protein